MTLTPQQRFEHVTRAAELLESARDELRKAGARKAHAYVNRAIKSVQGAANHAYNRMRRLEREQERQT